MPMGESLAIPDYFTGLGPTVDSVKNLQNAIKFKLGMAQAQAETQQRQAEVAKFTDEINRRGQYQAAVQQYLKNPTAQGLTSLLGDFPEYHAQSADAFKALSSDRQTSDLTSMGEIAALAAGGNYPKAAEVLKSRIDADKEVGHEDPQDQYIYDGLNSGDPAKQKEAVGLLGMSLGIAAGPEHAASFLESQGLSKKPDVAVIDGIAVDQRTGQPLYQSPYPRIVPGTEGSFYKVPRVDSIPFLGGQQPATGQAAPQEPQPTEETPAAHIVNPVNLGAATNLGKRFGTVTSTVRTVKHNRDVGGVANSYHLTGHAIDIARRPGVTHAQIEQAYRNAGYHILESLDEGDHSHLALAGGPGTDKASPLPPGAKFVGTAGGRRVIELGNGKRMVEQ